MFRTTNHYLGLGPVSSARGDEVWVLLGVNVLMVLRRLDHGRYQVIGEAYVHDIMHGEAIRGDVPLSHWFWYEKPEEGRARLVLRPTVIGSAASGRECQI